MCMCMVVLFHFMVGRCAFVCCLCVGGGWGSVGVSPDIEECADDGGR